MITPTTTREEYHAHLVEAYARSQPFGGNEAIRKHRDKVATMTEAQWVEHRAQRLKAQEAFRNSSTMERLAAEFLAKQR